MWAIVPAKDFGGAKQRLASVLSPAERSGLFEAMLQDVMATLMATRGLAGIALVTNDPRADFYLRFVGVRLIDDRESRGQTAAVTQGARVLAAAGARGIIAVPGDVPLASPGEIESVLAMHGEERGMTIVPSRDGKGSNALACTPPDLIPFRFGEASFEPHCALARANGVEPRVMRLPGLGLDIDTPEDLTELLARGPEGATEIFLDESGIARRLKAPAAS